MNLAHSWVKTIEKEEIDLNRKMDGMDGMRWMEIELLGNNGVQQLVNSFTRPVRQGDQP